MAIVVHVMSGNRKCGLFRFNPSAVDDRLPAPAKAFQPAMVTTVEPPSDEVSEPLFTEEQEAIHLKWYEEGYDVVPSTAVMPATASSCSSDVLDGVLVFLKKTRDERKKVKERAKKEKAWLQ